MRCSTVVYRRKLRLEKDGHSSDIGVLIPSVLPRDGQIGLL